jgi:serine/threonine-protein kinase HipA
MIKVWTGGSESGLLERAGARGSTFLYLPGTPPGRAVSVSMPLRLSSLELPWGIAPIFEMNLPEGILRERLRLAFAKATGNFDELDLLAIVGRSQVGRLRYTGEKEQLHEDVPFQSVDEILAQRRGGDLYRYLLDKFATYSGISGVQPKVLIRDQQAFAADPGGGRLSQSYRGATHIVKFWEANEYPQLAANEYFCLRAAERCGLQVPPYQLADNAAALIVERFDLCADGTYRGFEDFCVLNGKQTAQKYAGSYETSIVRRFSQYADSPHVYPELEKLVTLIALNCALRNGDAHLKNFGIVYEDVLGEARLAPVYDLVTTTVYLPNDRMALTMNGSTQWPSARELQRFAETRAGATPARVRAILQQIADALSDTATELRAYRATHEDFAGIGQSMLSEWEKGISHSLTAV